MSMRRSNSGWGEFEVSMWGQLVNFDHTPLQLGQYLASQHKWYTIQVLRVNRPALHTGSGILEHAEGVPGLTEGSVPCDTIHTCPRILEYAEGVPGLVEGRVFVVDVGDGDPRRGGGALLAVGRAHLQTVLRHPLPVQGFLYRDLSYNEKINGKC